MKLYAIEDVKAEVLRNPFFVDHEVQAVRAFTQAANDPSTEIYKYPEDFRLVYIGDLDVSAGGFVSNPDPEKRVLGFASRYKEIGNG